MKKILFFCIGLLFTFSVFGQDNKLLNKVLDKSVPNLSLTTLDGQSIYTGDIKNDGNPIIISFWATWCTPCKKELNTIHQMYIDWQVETGVKLIAVSVDDPHTANRVRPYVNAQGWEYEILLDPNSEFRRAMGVTNIPHTFLINGEGKIVYSHKNYMPGDEYSLYDEVLKLTEDKK